MEKEMQDEKYQEWRMRLIVIADEMRDAEFDMQALSDLADNVENAAARCSELAD
jgi:hypothetical protein